MHNCLAFDEATLSHWDAILGTRWPWWLRQVPPTARKEPCPAARPCRYFQCRWHLAVERGFRLTTRVPLSEMPYSCLWDCVHDYPRGMTEDAIGKCLGIPQQTVHSVYTRAVDEFKKADPGLAAKMLNRFHDTEVP